MTDVNKPLPDDVMSQVTGSRVLVLSNRTADAHAIRELLLAAHFTCDVQVPAPEDPLPVVQANRPDLILLDMAARGPEALNLLARMRSSIDGERPILAACPAIGDWRADALAWGADDVIVKPLVAEELATRVRNLLLVRWLRRRQDECPRTSAHVQAPRRPPEEGDFTAAMLNRMEQAVIACDEQGDLVFANEAAIRLGLGTLQLGRPATLARGRLRSPDGRELTAEEDLLHRAWSGEEVSAAEVTVTTADRGMRTLVAGARPIVGAEARRWGAVVTLHDITDLRRVVEELRRGLIQDELTGLPNAALFFELANRAIATNAREHQPLALIAVTLDDVHEMSEYDASSGPQPFEATLGALGRKLPRLLRPGDVAARHGRGFLLLCRAPGADTDAQQIVERLQVGLSRPLEIARGRVEPQLGFGVAITDDAHFSAERLAEIATTAARRAQPERQAPEEVIEPPPTRTGW